MTSSLTNCMVPFMNSIFAGLSGLSCLFFMIGAIGNTTEKDTMKNIPWLILNYPGGNKFFYSLRAQYWENLDIVSVFEQCADTETHCEKCDSDGHTAYVLVIVSCLGALTCASLCAFMIKLPDFTFLKFVAAIFASFSTFFAGIALALFMGDCQDRIQNYFDGITSVGIDFVWGSGSILVATGMCCMFIVAVGLFASAKFCVDVETPNKTTQLPTSELSAV